MAVLKLLLTSVVPCCNNFLDVGSNVAEAVFFSNVIDSSLEQVITPNGVYFASELVVHPAYTMTTSYCF